MVGLFLVQTDCKGNQQMTLNGEDVKERAGLEVIKLFPCSTQLSTILILLKNVTIPTTVGILTFISMMNIISERLKARNFFMFRYFSFYEQMKLHAQLSRA